MARRRRRRRRRGESAQGGLIDRIWSYASDVRAPGVFLLLCGVLLVSTPWTRTPEPMVASWWETGQYAPDALGLAAGFAAAALVLFVGVLWNRYRLATDAAVEKEARPDASLDDSEVRAGVAESRLPGVAWTGAICMVTGIAIVVGYWIWAQKSIGVARVPIAAGETLDHYTLPHDGRGLRVMLPLRVRLSGLEMGDEPTAKVQLFAAGQDPPQPQSLTPGTGLDLDGFRLTFFGMRPDATKLRAVFGSKSPDTISATAGEGETFRLSLDGPEYKVLEVSRNYLGAMGPAAKVRAPEVGEFWVYQRASQTDVTPDLGHPIELEQVQTQPAAVFAIAPLQPFWPISAGGSLFVLGFALLIVFPERVVRQRRGVVSIWSFNEAGRVTEQTLAEVGPAELDHDETIDHQTIDHQTSDEGREQS